MPASSKSQQRFFGVVKAMQKGDIPKKGRAGKIAKSMNKDDVDDFASTKHKGKPEKVKREMKVRNLIKKMVREELAKMNEGKLTEVSAGVNVFYFYKKANKDKNKFFKMLSDFRKKHSDTKWMKMLNYALVDFNENPKKYKTIDDKQNKLFKNLQQNKKVYEGTCGYGENGELGEEPAGPHLIKKKKIKESGRNIAKTILQQLGGNKFIAMTGAKNLGFTNNGLQMKIGRNSKGITHVIISLKSTDTYDVEFIKMRGTSRKVVKKLKGVYNDMLRKIFTKYTGMRTSL